MDELLAKDTERFLLFIFFLLAPALSGHLLEDLSLIFVGLDLDEAGHGVDGPARLGVGAQVLLVLGSLGFFLSESSSLEIFALFLYKFKILKSSELR